MTFFFPLSAEEALHMLDKWYSEPDLVFNDF